MMEGRVSESSSRICQLLMIHMTGGAPFGFRIASIHSAGVSPFAVSTIRINGKAYRAGLLEADLVLAINGFSCYNGLSHNSATKLMEYDDPELTLHILRGENLCEDNIKTSLQSLDSQIVELTDNEVQSIIAKKQVQQPVGIPLWKSKLTNSLSHLNVSPSWLQPPPKTRPKMVEKRNDMPSLSHTIEHLSTNAAPNGLTDDLVHESWTKAETKANDDLINGLTTTQLKINKTTECNKDFQLSDKPISELRSKHLDCVSSQKYELNDAEHQSRQIELPSDVSIDESNTKIFFQSKPTTGHFDMASALNMSDSKVDKVGQNIITKQQLKNSDDHLRNRYRVEQNIFFKPVDQARYYDAESGQFRENSSEKLPKRRSNSISCYHMYIGSGVPKSSSVVENNRGHFQEPGECNRWKPSEENRKQFDGTVYQWANGAIKEPVTEFNQEVSKSPSTSVQLPQASSSGLSNICMLPSVNLSQQFYPPLRLSRNVESSTSHWSSNRPIQSATPTKQLQASSNKWETRSLRLSSPARQFSPAVDDLPLLGPNSPRCTPMSTTKLVPAYMSMTPTLHEAPPESILSTGRALPKLIRLRSNEDEAHSPSKVHKHFLPVNETALAKANSSQHYSDMKSVSYGTHMCSLSKSQITSTLGLETNRQKTRHEEISEPAYYHNAHKPDTSINQTCPVNANSNSLKTFLANEGKGGRLFARRRANSDAWIVGEKDEPNKTAAKSTISDRNITGIQAMAEPDVMQRRRSLATGHLQEPVHNDIGNNSHQYRSRTAQKLVNSFSSPRPFNEIQHTNRPNCHSQSSTRHRGVNQAVDPNAWQLRGATDHPITPIISQRVQPLQADLCPVYYHGTQANSYALQPNAGYTDL